MEQKDLENLQQEENNIVTLKPNIICSEHYFEYVNGTEVMCTKCPLGYGVTPDTEVKDGHIFLEGNLVI